MIELTIADLADGKPLGKISIKPELIHAVSEEKCNNESIITKIDIVAGGSWINYWVVETYDRVLRLVKL